MTPPPKIGRPGTPVQTRRTDKATSKTTDKSASSKAPSSTFSELPADGVIPSKQFVPLSQTSDADLFGLLGADPSKATTESLKAALDTAAGLLSQVKDSAFKAAGLNVLSALQQVLNGMLPKGEWLKLPFDQVWALARRRKNQKKKKKDGEKDGEEDQEDVEDELVRLFDEAGKPCFEEEQASP